MYEILSASYVELDSIKVTFRDKYGAEVVEFFASIEELADKYGEDDAEDVEEILHAGGWDEFDGGDCGSLY